jgi:hypothetical protein
VKITEFVDMLPEQKQQFDAIILVLGPESRAINVLCKYQISAPLKIAVVCHPARNLAYDGNEKCLDLADFDKILQPEFEDFLKAATANAYGPNFRIAIDISCMPRQLMAEIIFCILNLSNFSVFEITFCYSLAKFTKPLIRVVPNEAIEPVHPCFSGWPSRQSLPTSLITGLGYEPDKAEGASEYLDPSEQWGFIPVSPVEEFLSELEKNNASLITRLTSENRAIKYDIQQPARTFGQLEMVISDLLRRSNPILLPFGPKIFFALCLIQSFRHPEIGVWHVTGETHEEPIDRCASGVEIGFQIVLRKDETETNIF